jgi:hypothetical protein
VEELRGRIAELNSAVQRSEALLNLRDQRIIIWAGKNRKPEIVGLLASDTGTPEDRSAFLAFGRWLTPRSAAALEHAIAALRRFPWAVTRSWWKSGATMSCRSSRRF